MDFVFTPNHLHVAGQGGEGEADELQGGGGGDGRGPGPQLHRARRGDHRAAGPPHVPHTQPQEQAQGQVLQRAWR